MMFKGDDSWKLGVQIKTGQLILQETVTTYPVVSGMVAVGSPRLHSVWRWGKAGARAGVMAPIGRGALPGEESERECVCGSTNKLTNE